MLLAPSVGRARQRHCDGALLALWADRAWLPSGAERVSVPRVIAFISSASPSPKRRTLIAPEAVVKQMSAIALAEPGVESVVVFPVCRLTAR